MNPAIPKTTCRLADDLEEPFAGFRDDFHVNPRFPRLLSQPALIEEDHRQAKFVPLSQPPQQACGLRFRPRPKVSGSYVTNCDSAGVSR